MKQRCVSLSRGLNQTSSLNSHWTRWWRRRRLTVYIRAEMVRKLRVSRCLLDMMLSNLMLFSALYLILSDAYGAFAWLNRSSSWAFIIDSTFGCWKCCLRRVLGDVFPSRWVVSFLPMTAQGNNKIVSHEFCNGRWLRTPATYEEMQSAPTHCGTLRAET